MADGAAIEKFFCNVCKGSTNHFIRGDYKKAGNDEGDGVYFDTRALIIECCGCEHVALVKKTHFSEDFDYLDHPETGKTSLIANWDETIYPPVSYRTPPDWFADLPDQTLQLISREIYKSLQTESLYLATFGSRTLIDRLILLTVGDKGNFGKGLAALREEGKLSDQEREILEPVVQAGHAAAHRGWSPTMDQLGTILDTVEGLIHRLLVLPKLAEELEGAVPGRNHGDKPKASAPVKSTLEKIEAAPKALRAVYDELAGKLRALGNDVTLHPQKHYIAFRRNRNFASVQIYNQKKVVRVYLNVDPDEVKLDEAMMRDVRQIGHFGTGDLEITITSKADIEKIHELLQMSYAAS